MKKQLKEINVGSLLKEIDEAEEINIIAESVTISNNLPLQNGQRT